MADARAPASGLACGAAVAPSRVTCTCSSPRRYHTFGGRSRGLCFSPLRGRWRKGGYLHGMGGGRLPGGLVATKLDVKVNGSVVESIDESERHGCAQPINSTLTPHWDPT